MEQSLLDSQDRRWVNAIDKLTNLTYDGKLQWQRYEMATGGERRILRYAAKLGEQHFSLIVSEPAKSLAELRTRLLVGMPNLGLDDSVTFIASQDNQQIKKLENLTVLQALANAIRAKTASIEEKENALLKAIENA